MAKVAKKKGNKKKKGGGFFGGVGGYKGVKKKDVRRLTNGVINNEVRDLRRQRNEVTNEYRKDREVAKRDYERGRGDIKHVFRESGKMLTGLQARTADTFNKERSYTNQASAALQQQVGNTYDSARAAGSEELARLGIAGGGNFSQMDSDRAHMQSLAAQSGYNADTTMGMASSNADVMMNMLRGMNTGSKVSQMGQNLNRRNDAFAEAQQNRNDELSKVRDAVTQAKMSRDDVFFQLLQQLQQTGWSQFMDRQNLNLQRKQLNKK